MSYVKGLRVVQGICATAIGVYALALYLTPGKQPEIAIAIAAMLTFNLHNYLGTEKNPKPQTHLRRVDAIPGYKRRLPS